MALCWPNLIPFFFIYYLTILAYHVEATFTLSSELTNFVPGCAQACFISFLEENYSEGLCGTTPSLDCLCENNGSSGYTVGEGAVQCLISEVNIGYCQGDDSSEAKVVSAYQMCNGQVSALPNTHATITATLVIETSMPSIVLVASVAASTTSSGQSTTTTQIQTSMSASTSQATTFSTTTKSKTSSASSTSSTSSSSETAVAAAAPFTKPQVVGIVVGTVGGAAVGLGLLIFLCCLRRRRQDRERRDSDMLPFQLDPNNRIPPSNKYSSNLRRFTFHRGPGGTPDGVAAKVSRIPPPVPLRLSISEPNMFSRRSVKAIDAIGLALSPTTPATPSLPTRRSSRLLPDKPDLNLQPPPKAVNPPSTSTRHISTTSRRSEATTTFESDTSSILSPSASDFFSRHSTVKSLGEARVSRFRQVNAKPAPGAPTFFIDDEEVTVWQGGKGKGKIAGRKNEFTVKPLSLGRGASFSQPRVPTFTGPSSVVPALPQAAVVEGKGKGKEIAQPEPSQTLQIPPPSPALVSTTSSLYSLRGSSIASTSTLTSLPPGTSLNPPPKGRKSYKALGPYDYHNSNASFTSIETDTSFEPAAPAVVSELSPVVESPASSLGHSPVTYPKIPLRLSATMMFAGAGAAPPRQPDYTRALGGSSSSEASKPTIRVIDPPPKPQSPAREPTSAGRRDIGIISPSPSPSPTPQPRAQTQQKQSELEVRRSRRASRLLSNTTLNQNTAASNGKIHLMPLPSLGHSNSHSHSQQSSISSIQNQPFAPVQTPQPTPSPTPAEKHKNRLRDGLRHARFSFQQPPTPPSTVSPVPAPTSKLASASGSNPTGKGKGKEQLRAGLGLNTHFCPTPPPSFFQPGRSAAFTQATGPQPQHLYTGSVSPSHDYPVAPTQPSSHLNTLPSQRNNPYTTTTHHHNSSIYTSQIAHSSSTNQPLTDATGGFSIFPSTSPYTQNPPLPLHLLTHSPLENPISPLFTAAELEAMNKRGEREDKYTLSWNSSSTHGQVVSSKEKGKGKEKAMRGRGDRLEEEEYPQPSYPPRTSSRGSTSSSLLAKRRGSLKAAELTSLLQTTPKKTSPGKNKAHPSPKGWRVLKPQEISQAKRNSWRPMASVSSSSSPPKESHSPKGLGIRSHHDSERIRQEVERAGYRREGEVSREEGGRGRGELPATPGWEPKLTPTRRGGELFLSVR